MRVTKWKQYWLVEEGMWQVIYVWVLTAIMLLWRPSRMLASSRIIVVHVLQPCNSLVLRTLIISRSVCTRILRAFAFVCTDTSSRYAYSELSSIEGPDSMDDGGGDTADTIEMVNTGKAAGHLNARPGRVEERRARPSSVDDRPTPIDPSLPQE